MPIASELLGVVRASIEEIFGLVPEMGEIVVEEPIVRAHGDYSTNAALVLARPLARPPRELAAEIAARVRVSPLVARAEVAGPGFVNIDIAPAALASELSEILARGEEAFRPVIGHGERVQVEFVSANPTGPLHVGNGWLATYGDSLARVLAFVGYEVVREYYVNDTGGQIRQLGASLLAARAGREMPEGGYRGDYILELARSYTGPEDEFEAGSWAVPVIMGMIRASLEELGIEMDSWFSQRSIEESGAVDEVVSLLAAKEATYDHDGALWFASTRFGDPRDRVLRKSNGDFTYLAGDIAYHYNKLVVRGFDLVIDVLGADHHGQVASLMAAMAALGIDPSRLEIRLGQMVSLVEDGKALKFSKRAGTAVPLSWLVEQLGKDATRLLILSTSIDRAVQADLAKARAASMENPVYYMQYAHARISSIFRTAAERGVPVESIGAIDAHGLSHPREIALAKDLSRLGEVIARAAKEREPHRLVTWLSQTSSDVHGFYHDCPVLAAPPEVRDTRLALLAAVRIALAATLGLLGVEPLEVM